MRPNPRTIGAAICALGLFVGATACSGSDDEDERDRVTRIDGPAVVDRDDSGVTQSGNDDE